MGAPFMFGILDLGTINPMAFNHSGTVGLGELAWSSRAVRPVHAVVAPRERQCGEAAAYDRIASGKVHEEGSSDRCGNSRGIA